jgi:hypothetical protein
MLIIRCFFKSFYSLKKPLTRPFGATSPTRGEVKKKIKSVSGLPNLFSNDEIGSFSNA